MPEGLSHGGAGNVEARGQLHFIEPGARLQDARKDFLLEDLLHVFGARKRCCH